MMKIKIKTKGKRFLIPVPFALLNVCARIITFKRLVVFVNRSIEKDGKTRFRIPDINSGDLKPLLKELSHQKGLMLVETTLKDGTEVSIRL